MEDKLKRAKNILSHYQQEHLLQFYDELEEEQKKSLVDQILEINFGEILYLYNKSKTDIVTSTERIEPLPYTNKQKLSTSELSLYTKLVKQFCQ